MIPRHVRLKGFLCYKEEREISFDNDATLWMLSGLNGSGKSSIFDAVTYALFGEHRGSGKLESRSATDLVNKDCDGFTVEFDFQRDQQLYRIRRTLRMKARGSPSTTQQIYRLANEEGESWAAIEGTNYKKDFDQWIEENVGLSYETFTSSVLLLQGKADKLLDSKAEGRRAVLAGIVNLDFYERLHAKADKQRKDLEFKCDTYKSQLELLPEVKPEELTAAEERIRIGEEARQTAHEQVERLRELESRARAWGELQLRLVSVRRTCAQAKQLLADAADIERDVERLRELREVLPRLREIADCRAKAHNADVALQTLSKERQKTEDALAERRIALDQALGKRATTQRLLENEETVCEAARKGLLEVRIHVERLEQYERNEGELAQVREQLKRLPADADRDASEVREVCERLQALETLIPILARFQRQRDELRLAIEQETACKKKRDEIIARGGKLKEEIDRLTPLAAKEAQALQQTNERVAEARTEVKQAKESLTQATLLEGSATCRHCAQPLPPGHIEEEKRKRREVLTRAEAHERQEKETLRKVEESERKLREELKRAEDKRGDERSEYKQSQSLCEHASKEISRIRAECVLAFEEMPPPQRKKVRSQDAEDWLATTYPTAEDLAALREQSSELPQARRRLKQAEDAKNAWMQWKAKESTFLEQSERLRKELPSDREEVRARHARLDLDVKTHENTIKGHKANLKAADKDIERLTREREETERGRKATEAKVQKQELDREYAHNAIDKSMKSLSDDWKRHAQDMGLTEVHGWESEKTDLERSRVDERSRELAQARLNFDVMRAEVEKLEAQQTEFSEEMRVEPATIRARIVEASQAEKVCTEELSSARHQLVGYKERQAKREELGNKFVQVEGEYQRQKYLTQLLSKDRLQLHLVRQAEKSVVEYANLVLDRLSGGQLYLKLRGEAEGDGATGKALELEAFNRDTGEKPINVAFLSGSQKFRVAVSLALGIGQFASKQHRPIESVIIDEGFGCLDSQGRQVMIQELQNLRSHMRCILLVSHQEEFAEAFSDGYHFKLENGATTVERVQK